MICKYSLGSLTRDRTSVPCTGRQIFFFLKIYLFIYLFLFLAVLGFRFCARAFSSFGERGPLFIAVPGPLTIAASLVAEHRLQTCRLSSCGSRAQLLRSMWDLPRLGLEPVSPALAGRFSTTAPPGKPCWKIFNHSFNFSVVICLFIFSISSWFNLRRLCFSKNVSISSRLSILLA